MVFSRRDLIAKCAALGVVSLAPNLNAEAAAEGWLAAEDKVRSVTPTAEVGPFYQTRGAQLSDAAHGGRSGIAARGEWSDL